jgi:mono/diheme cytochrome c family protein
MGSGKARRARRTVSLRATRCGGTTVERMLEAHGMGNRWWMAVGGWGRVGASGVACGLAVMVTAAAAEPARNDARLEAGHVQYAKNCAGCHGPEARGDGPDAAFWMQSPVNLRQSDVLQRYPDAELVPFLREGARLRLSVRREAFARHAQDTDALYTFLRRIPEAPWDRVDAGMAVYLTRCLACHDQFGRPQRTLPSGVRAPQDLSDPAFQSATDEATLLELVRHGRHSMPALVPRISESEASELVAYVRLLSPGFTLYDSYCMGCHGPEGQGGKGITADASAPHFAFDAAFFERQSPDKIRRAVWHMLRESKPTMPHFRSDLTPAQAQAIFAYLRSLPAETPPPAPAR